MQKKFKEIIVLADCDRFYVSVARVFDLVGRKRPTVVLSNNDGCVVSSCPEAKKFGAKTGVPYFEIKKDFEAAGGVAYSAEYTLFGDYSARVMEYLIELTSNIELYSVDEAFCVLTDMNENFDLQKVLEDLRKKIWKELRIPVSFGASYTKTLAKVAIQSAKKNKKGVFLMFEEEQIKNILSSTPTGDIWNIGSASEIKLKIHGIRNAWQITEADDKLIHKLLTIKGRRTQDELRGIPSIELMLDVEEKKEITTSRSFLKPVFDFEEVSEAISDHIFRATEKLRRTNQTCQHVSVFLWTNVFKDIPQKNISIQIPLEQGEDAPNLITKLVLNRLRNKFEYGYEYRKCGVILSDLRPKNQRQLSLFGESNERNEKIVSAIDCVNKKFGTRTLKIMSCSKNIPYPDKAKKLSRFTTRLEDIPTVKIN